MSRSLHTWSPDGGVFHVAVRDPLLSVPVPLPLSLSVSVPSLAIPLSLSLLFPVPLAVSLPVSLPLAVSRGRCAVLLAHVLGPNYSKGETQTKHTQMSQSHSNLFKHRQLLCSQAAGWCVEYSTVQSVPGEMGEVL